MLELALEAKIDGVTVEKIRIIHRASSKELEGWAAYGVIVDQLIEFPSDIDAVVSHDRSQGVWSLITTAIGVLRRHRPPEPIVNRSWGRVDG